MESVLDPVIFGALPLKFALHATKEEWSEFWSKLPHSWECNGQCAEESPKKEAWLKEGACLKVLMDWH